MDVGFTRPLNHIASRQGDFIVRIIQGCRVEEHNREVLKEGRGGGEGHVRAHAPSIAFRHLPPNSARIAYATEGALFISAQLSTDTVSALQKVWVLVKLWKQSSAQART